MPQDLAQIIAAGDQAFVNFVVDSLGLLKFLSVVVSIILFYGIMALIIKTNFLGVRVDRFKEQWTNIDLTRHRTVKAWNQVLRRMKAGDESNLKLALIEADKILDEVLKLSGYRGETVADRLKQVTTAQFPNVNEIWAVHKIRNRIVHEPDFQITKPEAEEGVRIYARAFRQVGLID